MVLVARARQATHYIEEVLAAAAIACASPAPLSRVSYMDPPSPRSCNRRHRDATSACQKIGDAYAVAVFLGYFGACTFMCGHA